MRQVDRAVAITRPPASSIRATASVVPLSTGSADPTHLSGPVLSSTVRRNSLESSSVIGLVPG
jgi:hypothetical protein